MLPRRPFRALVLTIAVSGASLLATGCAPAERMTRPVYAVWVTRTEYRTPADIEQIMENCHLAGFNTVVFQVRGNGTVFYPSKIELWAEQFDFKDPGFDPLGVACDEAHRRHLELHAWTNAMPAWRGTKPPAEPTQVYHAHPEWFWYDQHGQRQALSDFYVSLNPCLPEVRAYIVSVMKEIVGNYNVDGLHLDYIRFPNEPPAIPRGSDIDYPRDARTLALYRAQTGKAPDDDAQCWNQWRADQVTQLVRDISGIVRKTRSSAALSASVGTSREGSMKHYRDEVRWVQEKLVDAMFPMNYKSDLERFDQGLVMWTPLPKDVAVVPGIWFAPNLTPEKGVEVVRRQIESSVARTGNFCLFSYGSLFGSGGRPARIAGSQPAGRRGRSRGEGRELRQRELVPYIQSLSRPAGPVAAAQ